MKIAFVIYDINVCGGTHKQLLKLIEYTERQGQDFVIITKQLNLDETYKGFKRYADKIHVCNYPSILNHRIIHRLIKYVVRWKFKPLIQDCDIINIHDNNFEEIYPLLRNKNVYWQINDLPGCFHVGVSAKYEDDQLAKKQRNYIIENTKYFKAISVNVGKNAERVKQCMNKDAHVFYCGVEPIQISRNIEDTFDRFNNRKINLLSSGVFFPYRNYETQIEVVEILKEKGYDVKLHIIGETRDKDYTGKIQSLINKKGLHDTITIEGQVDNKRFEYLHKNADMFLFINIDQSWGLAVFEAQSCGLPVIVSNSVGATEILHDDVDSLFVEPKDVQQITNKIIELATDKNYYTHISTTASEFHKEWTWDKAYCSKMYDLMVKGM